MSFSAVPDGVLGNRVICRINIGHQLGRMVKHLSAGRWKIEMFFVPLFSRVLFS